MDTGEALLFRGWLSDLQWSFFAEQLGLMLGECFLHFLRHLRTKPAFLVSKPSKLHTEFLPFNVEVPHESNQQLSRFKKRSTGWFTRKMPLASD
jgi:hypothetical protein